MYMILSERKRSINTAALFQKIIDLLKLPQSTFEEKIGEFYTTLSTDKRFILLDNGNWDLKARHTSNKVMQTMSEDDEEDEDEDMEEEEEEFEDDMLEDNYDATDDNDDYVDANEDIKDLVILDENELDQE